MRQGGMCQRREPILYQQSCAYQRQDSERCTSKISRLSSLVPALSAASAATARIALVIVLVSVTSSVSTASAAAAFVPIPTTSTRGGAVTRSSLSPLFRLAKRRTRNGSDGGSGEDKSDDFNRWYEAVDDRATPDDVFWGEMERQIRLNGGDPSATTLNGEGGVTNVNGSEEVSSVGGATAAAAGLMGVAGPLNGDYSTLSSSRTANLASSAPSIHMINQNQASNSNTNAGSSSSSSTSANKPMTPKMIEASLSEYAAFAVSDNWLDDGMVEQKLLREAMGMDSTTMNTNTKSKKYNLRNPYQPPTTTTFYESQLEKDPQDSDTSWDNSGSDIDDFATEKDDIVAGEDDNDFSLEDDDEEDEDDDDEEEDDDETMPREDDEPWDQWSKAEKSPTGQTNSDDDDDEDSARKAADVDRWFRRISLKNGHDVDAPPKTPQGEAEEDRLEELADARRMAALTITSPRLELARNNPKAAAFFQRAPDATEGLDQMWVAAVDNVCFKNLVGTYRNYGIQFADNFGDFQDGCLADGLATIEDVASYKARHVYAVTGLPCIASRTSFDIEPVPTDLNGGTALSSSMAASPSSSPSQRSASAIFSNPRVVSGYRFNDIGMHVDYICDVLRPLSECDRVTRFRTCLCYYDGQMEIYEYGICDVDLHFCNSLRTFIPVAQAINEMLKTLELTLGLVYQKWLKARMNEVLSSGGTGSASVKLRDRVLKQGRVLPNDIIDVSAFMDSMVDVNLMDECAKELSQFFINEKPSKILTVATTGLVVALPMAKYLQVPVVYARKERNVVMADTYIAAYSSKTVGKNRELLVSKSHIHADDRVLIVDDFLSSGSSQEALLRIVSQADATAVGIGVLLEKVYDSGRQSLSGFDVPIHSLCRISSVQSGVIQLMEEEGFDLMQKQKEEQFQKQQQQQLQQKEQTQLLPVQPNEPVKS